MSASAGRYSRVYWTVIDDPKFARVYDDDRALATWLRLLITAEMAYPATAIFPVGTSKKSVDVLVSAGLVELAGTNRYRVVGLAAERERRSAPGKVAASARWSNPEASAVRSHNGRNAIALPAKKEQEKEQEKEQQEGTHHANEEPPREPTEPERSPLDFDGDDHVDAYFRLTGSWPSRKVIPWLDRLAENHGPANVASAMAKETQLSEDRSTLLSRTETRLERELHESEKERKRSEVERRRKEREVVETMPEEQRRENLEKLRRMMVEAGLAAKRDQA